MERIPIDTHYLREILLKLLNIPSPSGYTDTIVRFTCDELERLGIPYELTRRGAIRATLHGEHNETDRAIVAHLDTLGGMTTRLKENGRLSLAPIGHWSSRFAEGARVTISTDRGPRRGTVLPLKASGHVYGDEIDTQPVAWSDLGVRVATRVHSYDELHGLGFRVGDSIAFDPTPEGTPNGFINSRHLDDKAGVACLLTAGKALTDLKIPLPLECHLLFTIFEEVGTGASGVLHGNIAEMVSIDNGTPAPEQNANEYELTFAMMDSTGPFDYHLTRRLISLANDHGIPNKRDVLKHYRCDAASALESGTDLRTALICFGVDSSHGYERTHFNVLEHLSTLLTLYIQTPLTVQRDRMERVPIEGFTEQQPI